MRLLNKLRNSNEMVDMKAAFSFSMRVMMKFEKREEEEALKIKNIFRVGLVAGYNKFNSTQV